MKRIFTPTTLCLLAMLSLNTSCSSLTQPTEQSELAARIYTQLANHYWQHGHRELALDRLSLALQQKPDFLPAQVLLKNIEMEETDKSSTPSAPAQTP
jgi:Tfp pilus assembly protein PilF